jgi:hypothetical protein
MPSAPALISRSRCTFPGVNLKLVMPALFLQDALSPAAAVEQLKLFRPWMRLLSENGAYKGWGKLPVI